MKKYILQIPLTTNYVEFIELLILINFMELFIFYLNFKNIQLFLLLIFYFENIKKILKQILHAENPNR